VRRLAGLLPSRLRRLPFRLLYHRGPMLMSRLRAAVAKARNPRAKIVFGRGTYLGPGFSLHAPRGGTFITHSNVEFRRNFRCELAGPDAHLEIGADSYLTYSVLIQCGTSITIGERCGLGHCTSVYDGSHKYRDLSRPFLEQGYNYRPLRIEDDAQIHGLCTIVNTVGTRAIVGANSIVTKPAPPYTLFAGTPAKVIDYFGPPGEDPREREAAEPTTV
jgi:acetyltransferase-like isoleucine patch superfamily enzyme